MVALPLTSLQAGETLGGVPLLVLHGLFGSARNWNQLLKRFGARRPAMALDMRNHGESPWDSAMGYPDMAADLLRFMDDRGIARADVLGHSMGGKAAMTLALLHPDRVRRLVVADIAPVTYGHSHAPYVAAMRAARLDGITRRAEVEAQLADAVPSPSMRSFLAQNLTLDHGAFRWRLNLEAIDAAMDTLIGFPDLSGRSFAGSSLFVGGGRSDYLAPETVPAVRRYFPAARIEMIPDAEHWLHVEKPDAFMAVVDAFLDQP
ncbi:alpha/beta fold hydrolase [Oleisolibacter albus]|uniref:alpha/beta fold hydrolase n=1 Tax=Oleisolibacter albus TaxID=2171757 RepID=UPI000DF37E1C|nr:alpha/beta fold hydrolase [Oleisolibacter albus]